MRLSCEYKDPHCTSTDTAKHLVGTVCGVLQGSSLGMIYFVFIYMLQYGQCEFQRKYVRIFYDNNRFDLVIFVLEFERI